MSYFDDFAGFPDFDVLIFQLYLMLDDLDWTDNGFKIKYKYYNYSIY